MVEIINSVYTMISLQTELFRELVFSSEKIREEEEKANKKKEQKGIKTWKKNLNKIMMMVEIVILFWLITR
jgi:uncharacterized oligopeptide transporter (OPT) family protein